MEQFLQFALPSIVALIVAAISGFVTYFISINQFRNDNQKDLNAKTIQLQIHHHQEKYDIYKQLNCKLMKLLNDCIVLFPDFLDYLPSDKEEKNKIFIQRYNNASKSVRDLDDYFYANAPFVDFDIFYKIEKIIGECFIQINWYHTLIIVDDPTLRADHSKQRVECYKKSKTFATYKIDIINFFRDKVKKDEEIISDFTNNNSK